MSEKKGLFGGLFGKKKKSGCCNLEIIEETACDCNNGCCQEANIESGSGSKVSVSEDIEKDQIKKL